MDHLESAVYQFQDGEMVGDKPFLVMVAVVEDTMDLAGMGLVVELERDILGMVREDMLELVGNMNSALRVVEDDKKPALDREVVQDNDMRLVLVEALGDNAIHPLVAVVVVEDNRPVLAGAVAVDGKSFAQGAVDSSQSAASEEVVVGVDMLESFVHRIQNSPLRED